MSSPLVVLGFFMFSCVMIGEQRHALQYGDGPDKIGLLRKKSSNPLRVLWKDREFLLRNRTLAYFDKGKVRTDAPRGKQVLTNSRGTSLMTSLCCAAHLKEP